MDSSWPQAAFHGLEQFDVKLINFFSSPERGRMFYVPSRHEPLQDLEWDENRAHQAIERIVRNTEDHFSPESYWPLHPRDTEDGPKDPLYCLYYGACGVIWALHYLKDIGAVSLQRSYASYLETVLNRNRQWLGSFGSTAFSSYLMGDTPAILLRYWLSPEESDADELAKLIESNIDHPTRELMWGSPGTLLTALYLYERTHDGRWAELFRKTSDKLWSQLLWSPEYQCHYWTQDMYQTQSSYLDGVHGFVVTALPLIHGRHLLNTEEWKKWEECIINTVQRSATWEGQLVNWRVWLYTPEGRNPPMLMQLCHGAPGFVTCLADMPGSTLDATLVAAGEAIWAAGPLIKGSNLCHGTGGNGYAFLKLYQRTKDIKWLERARAFAMHGIQQTEDDAMQYGQMRYSLWTGDLGFAIYLWDCIRGLGEFPTLDVFFPN
jgi:hypothetical protein